MRNSLSAGFFCLALAASAASPDFRTPPLGAASLATNLVATWGGYTFGCAKNGYNDHIFVEPGENLHALTVCSWVAMRDADIIDQELLVPIESPSRKTNVQPGLVYTPNVERAAPDLLGGAWGWGGGAITVAGTNAFDYAFAGGGVTFLEYVEFTGPQIVELDFVFTPRSRIEADWHFTQVATKQQRVFCQRANPGLHTELYINGSGKIGWAYERDNLNGWKSTSTAHTNRVVYGINGPTREMYHGGTSWTIANLSSMTDADCGTNSMTLGRKLAATPTYARCFGVVAWKSGNIVRNLRPAVSSDGVVGLFDLVAGRMHGSITGTALVAGPEKTAVSELERCYSLAWNGGATGTNTWPRGVYTVVWSNLTSTLTLTAGGTDMTLEAPAGVRNVVPGEAAGFILSGSGSGHVGISRTKVNPIYQTRLGSRGAGSDAEVLLNAALVGTNWCFVAHRVALTADSHTNACDIIQLDGRHATEGHAPELPPDGCDSLLTNGLYQLVYTAVSDLRDTFIYEWDRRQFGRWLSDEDLAAIYEDGVRTREAFGYPPCVYSNAVYQPDP